MIAGEALLAGGSDDAKARLLPRIAAGEIATLALGDGPVLDADRAAIVLAVDGDDLVEVDRSERDLGRVDGPDDPARRPRPLGATSTPIGDGAAARARAELVGRRRQLRSRSVSATGRCG